MKPTFQTKRLDVFKIDMERGDGGWTVYLAYERPGAARYEFQIAVHCAKRQGDNCVEWIEARGRQRRGLALELLNGIAERMGLALYPNQAIAEASEVLFAKHERWFAERESGP
jgi:hypothetical protein